MLLQPILKSAFRWIPIYTLLAVVAGMALCIPGRSMAQSGGSVGAHLRHGEGPGLWAQPQIDFEIMFAEDAMLPDNLSAIRVSLDSDKGSIDAELAATNRKSPGLVLKGTVAITHRTSNRLFVVHIPGQGDRICNANLPPDPPTTETYGAWLPCAEVFDADAAASRSPEKSERASVRTKVWRPQIWRDAF